MITPPQLCREHEFGALSDLSGQGSPPNQMHVASIATHDRYPARMPSSHFSPSGTRKRLDDARETGLGLDCLDLLDRSVLAFCFSCCRASKLLHI